VHFDQPVHITSVTIYETPGNVEAAPQAYPVDRPEDGSDADRVHREYRDGRQLEADHDRYGDEWRCQRPQRDGVRSQYQPARW
jgi:hypothetical protein